MFAGGPFAEHFCWALRKVGTDRVIFGSDYPLDHPLQAIQAVNQLGFSDSELKSIMHRNRESIPWPVLVVEG